MNFQVNTRKLLGFKLTYERRKFCFHKEISKLKNEYCDHWAFCFQRRMMFTSSSIKFAILHSDCKVGFFFTLFCLKAKGKNLWQRKLLVE